MPENGRSTAGRTPHQHRQQIKKKSETIGHTGVAHTSVARVGACRDHFPHVRPVNDAVLRDVPDPNLVVQTAADEVLVVHRIKIETPEK